MNKNTQENEPNKAMAFIDQNIVVKRNQDENYPGIDLNMRLTWDEESGAEKQYDEKIATLEHSAEHGTRLIVYPDPDQDAEPTIISLKLYDDLFDQMQKKNKNQKI